MSIVKDNFSFQGSVWNPLRANNKYGYYRCNTYGEDRDPSNYIHADLSKYQEGQIEYGFDFGK